MSTIAVVGAGSGLGRAVARRYGREGYDVALVARREPELQRLADDLAHEGVQAYAVPADLGDTDAAASIAERIRARSGDLDTLYYGPSVRGYVPVLDLTANDVAGLMPIAVYSLIELTRAFVAGLIERGAGAIQVAAASPALHGIPQLSGTAVLAAQRHYLQSLEAQLAGSGVSVTRLYIGGIIQNSAFYRQQEADRAAGRATMDLALVDPAQLAERLWAVRAAEGSAEIVWPPDTDS